MAGLNNPYLSEIYGSLSQNPPSVLFGNPCLVNQANTEVQTDISNLITYMTSPLTKTSPGGFESYCKTGTESSCSVTTPGLATVLINIATTINQFIEDSKGLVDGYLIALVDYLTLNAFQDSTSGSRTSLSSQAEGDPTGASLIPYLKELIDDGCDNTKSCNAFSSFLMNVQEKEYNSSIGTCISGCDNTNNPVSDCSSSCANKALSCCPSQ